MRGHIEKRSENSYSVVIRRGKDPNTGKYLQSWFTVKGTKKDAEKKLSEVLHQLDNGVFMKPAKTTVAEYLGKWLRDYAKPNLSPRSYERYESIIRVHMIPSLGSIPLTQLKPEHVQGYYTSLLDAGLAPLTVRYHHVILHLALKTAVKWGVTSRNVTEAAEPPRGRKKEMQTWNEQEIVEYLNRAKKTEYYTLFHTALFTGMRRSELLALRWQDVDLITGQVSVSRSLHHLNDGTYLFSQPKTAKSQRTIALTPSSVMVMREYEQKQKLEGMIQGKTLTNQDLIFCHPDGRPLRANSVSRAWGALAKQAGLKVIRFHDARHSHASLMLKQGTHPKIVQERLGHSTISVTLDTYSHVAPGLQQAAAARFDDAFVERYN